MPSVPPAKINSNGKRPAETSSNNTNKSTKSPSKGGGGDGNGNGNSGSGSGTPKRQRRENAISASIKDRAASPTPTPAAAAAAAKATDFGTHLMTQLTYVVDFLKAKGVPKTLQEVLDHLTLGHLPEPKMRLFVGLMAKHQRIEHIPAPKDVAQEDRWRMGTYQFKAKIPGVHDKISLLSHLQQKRDASSLSVKDLKDGWPDCDQALTELENEHKILVVRTKKDNIAKFIWLDDARLWNTVDTEFIAMWHKCELPAPDDMVRKLIAVGQKPSSEAPQNVAKVTTKAAKKRKSTRPAKHQSNAHLAHLLKDYTHLNR
ncbi:hypothetical protein GGS20DRAFT_375425 [Poronia punctata]|nr:hypothetical protein GGS20DRAFT_375425 [Poronia punctata]